MKFLLSIAGLLALSNTAVVPFDSSAIEKVFKQKQPTLFLFASDNEQSEQAKKAFEQVDTEVFLTVSQAKDGHGLFDRLAEYLGVNTQNTPAALYLGQKQDKYNFEGKFTEEQIENFIQKVQKGEVEQFLKSAPIPQTNDQPVKIGVGKNFKELVLDSDKQFLVEFYAPWCGHCKNLQPHYNQAAKRLLANPNVVLVKVDSTQNQIADLDIQGFPTLKFYKKDKTQAPIDYNGGRDADAIISWIKQHTQYQWVQGQKSTQEL